MPSEPAYVGSMIPAVLGAMTPDGYNPCRVDRDGIDWEVSDPHNMWSYIGYWGDHQVVYLLPLMEAAQAHDPVLLPDLWDRLNEARSQEIRMALDGRKAVAAP